jgi:hypothetical protein
LAFDTIQQLSSERAAHVRLEYYDVYRNSAFCLSTALRIACGGRKVPKICTRDDVISSFLSNHGHITAQIIEADEIWDCKSQMRLESLNWI